MKTEWQIVSWITPSKDPLWEGCGLETMDVVMRALIRTDDESVLRQGVMRLTFIDQGGLFARIRANTRGQPYPMWQLELPL